jgi:ribonuclease H2 subunit C
MKACSVANMLAIQPPNSNTTKTTSNILPCSIKHNGPIPTSERYWAPKAEEDGTSTAYFRGRKLRGRNVKVPEGYRGVVLQKTDQTLSTHAQQPSGAALAEQLRRMEEDYADDDGDEMDVSVEKEAEVKIMETKATFDEVVIWGHEMVPDEEDVYVKGMEEWVGFAEAMHSYDTPTK